MGSCLSKKHITCSSSTSSTQPVQIPEKIDKIKSTEPQTNPKKEIFIIKHTTEVISSPQNSIEKIPNKTPSCTNEELDAILIQCGRLSRTSSGGRKYSGSKRSYDFDNNESLEQEISEEKTIRRSRRTPSRERSNSKSPGKRRVSRSPDRRVRSESPNNANLSNVKPGKMVSVPPSLVTDQSQKSSSNVKRIQVKRNVGGDVGTITTGVSPRARSPARLSRSNSRKGECSPYRRNPLSEIDTNIISQAPNQKRNPENKTVVAAEKKANSTKTDNNMTNSNCKTKEQEKTKIAVNVISSGQAPPITRSRSSRLSRDLDNSSSYTALLLEDIQNFHQKNTNASPPSFSLPPCVTKACSILDAVADLNSSTGSNLSEERKRNIINSHLNKSNEEKTILPVYVESEVVVGQEDDLMKPSFHKYVTVRRGMTERAELEEQESSGSNSFVSSQQILGSSSSWEPNSAESTDRWTSNSSSSKAVSRNNESRISHGRNRIGSKGPIIAST